MLKFVHQAANEFGSSAVLVWQIFAWPVGGQPAGSYNFDWTPDTSGRGAMSDQVAVAAQKVHISPFLFPLTMPNMMMEVFDIHTWPLDWKLLITTICIYLLLLLLVLLSLLLLLLVCLRCGVGCTKCFRCQTSYMES